ncbi:hypothetical protein BH20ACT21_BH20ACT21_12290 [soil metagenome]
MNELGEREEESLVVVRDDFWAFTSDKQLNFLRHVKTLLNINGRAAIVIPDNVLFERRSQGGCPCAGRSRWGVRSRPLPFVPF